MLAAGLELDLIVNATPVPDHEQVSRAGIEAGLHVYSEKPLAITYVGACELISAARARGVRLVAAPDSTTKPWFDVLNRLVESGELGTIHSAYGRISDNMSSDGQFRSAWYVGPSGGVLRDLGSYQLTELTALFGPAASVTATLRTVVPLRTIAAGRVVRVESEDLAVVTLAMKNGVVATIDACSSDGAWEDPRLEIRGTEGTVQIRHSSSDTFEIVSRAGGTRIVSVPTASNSWCSGVREFAEDIVTGSGLAMTAEHAAHVVEIIEGSISASRTSRSTELRSNFDEVALRPRG